MKKGAWIDEFDHVGFNGNVPTTAGGVVIPTGTGNWIAQAVVSQGVIKGIDGEPGTNGIIQLKSGNSNNSQLVLYKGLKQTVNIAFNGPEFGNCPAEQIRCVSVWMRIPGSFATDMGFRIVVSNNPIFPDAASATIGFFYDHDTSPGPADPFIHTVTRNGAYVVDNVGPAPTPGGWVRFDMLQETPGEIKFFIANALIHTHVGSSVPDIAALLVSIQVFNRVVNGKIIEIDTTGFDPVGDCELPPSCPAELACVLRPANSVYVVGKASDCYPNIIEAVQAINSSSNAPSAINRTVIYVMPGQYSFPLPPAPPVPMPAFVGIRGFDFTCTELLNARFVHDGEQVSYRDLFITTSEGADFSTHFDLAGHRIVNFTSVQHLSHLPLIRQSGANWYTMGLKDCGSSYLGNGSKGYAIEWINTGSKRNCDVYHQLLAMDVFFLQSGQIGPNGAGGVRAVDVQDLRAMSGELRVNDHGICWKLEGAVKTDLVQFVQHRCNNRFAGNFANAKSIVSDSLKVQIDNCSLPRCTTPASAPFDPTPQNTYITYVP